MNEYFPRDTFHNLGRSSGVDQLPSRPLRRQAIVYKFADSRFGHLLGINRQKIEYVEAFFLKHGKISTFFGRLIPAVRQFISIPAGLARMRLPAFILFTTLGSAIWNSILVLLGYYLAQILPEDRLLEELEIQQRNKLCFVALVTLALITWYLKRKLKACR